MKFALAIVCLVAAAAANAQQPNTAAIIAAQKKALAPLAYMDGVWRGTAWTMLPSGEKRTLTQTERIGPFLDGTVKVIEGRGYEPDGNVGFNALGILSYDAMTRSFSMRSYAMGHSGDFPVTIKPDGFTWEIPRRGMTIVYTATFKDGSWHEVGERLVPDQEPVRFFEMRLQRVGDTEWPAGSPVSPR